MGSTEIVVAVALVALLLWEAWTLKSSTDQHRTISTVVRGVARRSTFVVFMAGMLCGHWFWPMCG